MQTCAGCHQPEKLKGGLDVTSFQALTKGGKHGQVFKSGKPDDSELIIQTTGDKPEMPAKGDPLSPAEVAVLRQWIAQGARDDTPADMVMASTLSASGAALEPGPTPPSTAPTYLAPPVITAMAFSPKGEVLAISGYHEVLLYKPDGSGLLARLPSASSRVNSLAFSPDGKLLASAGGEPAEFGHLQIWDVASYRLLKNFKTSHDTLFGVCFSPDGKQIAFGCADKSARVVSLETDKETLRLDQHTDWVLATCFTADGKRILTGGRDKAMKLTDLSRGQFIDDVNNPLEPVMCFARHPTKDVVAYGGALGTPRIYKISDNQGRTNQRLDNNLLMAYERQPGPVNAVAFSPDGSLIAAGSIGEVRIYRSEKPVKPMGPKPARSTQEGRRVRAADALNPAAVNSDDVRVAILSGHTGAVFAVAFSPDGKQLLTGGFDGKVRVFEIPAGTLVKEFVPVPVGASAQASAK